MKQKEITIAGKQVKVGYCFATEISFKELTDDNITNFMQECSQLLEKGKMPDIKKSICLILAAVLSYYQSKDEEPPIDDKVLMYECNAEEIGKALGIVIGLCFEFYRLPKGEPQDKKEEGGETEKNA